MNKAAAPASHTKISLWTANVIAFFDLPNPRIFTVFISGSVVTFTLGIALIIEWILHGQHHLGYHWIVYYAPLMMALPVFIWIVCLISANFLCHNDQTKQIHNDHLSVQPQQFEVAQDQLAVVLIDKIHDDHLSGTLTEKFQPEQFEVPQDQLAALPIHNIHDGHPSCAVTEQPACTSLVPVAPEMYDFNNKSSLKRTFSLKMSSTTIDRSTINRTFSSQY